MTERWRLGNHYSIHVYCGDKPIATFHDPDDALRAVIDHDDSVDDIPTNELAGWLYDNGYATELGVRRSALVALKELHRRKTQGLAILMGADLTDVNDDTSTN